MEKWLETRDGNENEYDKKEEEEELSALTYVSLHFQFHFRFHPDISECSC